MLGLSMHVGSEWLRFGKSVCFTRDLRFDRRVSMATKFRAASFNVENLFSRAKILNFEDHAKASRLLKMVDELNILLRHAVYSDSDKKNILSLSNELNDYIIIREDMGSLFVNKGDARRVGANGKADWSGVIEFKRAAVKELARKSTAAVFKQVKADIMCVVEAENRPMLVDFNTNGLAAAKFDQVMCIDGNDKRGIDVGLLTKFPIRGIRTNIYDGTSTSRIFSRDCLELDLELPDGRMLYILCNHFVSKMNGDPPSSRKRRMRQARRVAEILGGCDLKKDLVIVAGDMNDTPDSPAMKPLVKLPGLHDVLEWKFGKTMTDRWTYKYRNELNQIDYLLVSTPLRDALVDAGIERRGIHEIEKVTGEKPFSSVTHWTTAASDHGAVWADFKV